MPGVPGNGLHLLRLGDWGLRRASNSIDRFNVAPQAMAAKQNGGKYPGQEKRPPKMWVCWSKLVSLLLRGPRAFLPLHNNGVSSLSSSQRPSEPAEFLKRHNGRAHHYRKEGGGQTRTRNTFVTDTRLEFNLLSALIYKRPVFNK